MTLASAACIAAPSGPLETPSNASQYSIPGIHCAACIGKIERGLSTLVGLTGARVNLSQKRLSVSGTVDPGLIISTLHGLGFEAFPLDRTTLTQTSDTIGRALLMRLAVAGFAMMNVMLLSVAVWSGAADATRDLFHLISAMIALPVVAYSGQPFLRSAYQALRARRLNMDVPISLAIVLAAGMSLFETLNGGAHAYFDAALSLTFFLLVGRYMDHRTRLAARSAAKELAALEVDTAQILTPSGPRTVPASQLKVGDRVLVPTGARVPVDGRLVSDHALLDRSLVTGESAPADLTSGAAIQAGEINVAAPLTLRATAVGQDTTLRRMARLVETAETGRNHYTALADRAAQVYAPAVHVLAVLAFAGWVIATSDIRLALNIAFAVLIITCPCALGLAVPAVSTAAISRLFSMGYLVKHATALERLAEVTHAVFDKTGTLSAPAVTLDPAMGAAGKAVAKALAQHSSHPMARAVGAALNGISPAQVTQITEVAGQGITGQWHGQTVRLGRGAWLNAGFADMGLRIGDGPAMRITTAETPRAGVTDALKSLPLPAEIITGDAPAPARRFAAQLDLPVCADMRPTDKVRHIQSLTDTGTKVLMVGDGLNDTAALAAAHASIAPASALDASRSASDVVLLKDTLADLPLILHVASMSQHLSKQNFAIAALYNAVAIPIALSGHATPLAAALAMSLSSITVLLNAQRIRFSQ